MKKTLCLAIAMLSLGLTVGCADNFNEKIGNELPVGNTRTSTVSLRVGELKESGLLDPLMNGASARGRSTDLFEGFDANQMEKIDFFINNTDAALEEIATMEDGDVQIRLIEVLFTGGTVGEVAGIMAEISEEMSSEFISAIEESITLPLSEIENSGRSISSIMDIEIGFFIDDGRNARSSSMSSSNTNRYIAFSATAIAGFVATKARWPWISIPGAVVATAATGSMAWQLGHWAFGTDLANFVSAAANLNFDRVVALLRTEHGVSLVKISSTTMGVYGIMNITPFGKILIAIVRNNWNSFATRVIATTGVTWSAFGVNIKTVLRFS